MLFEDKAKHYEYKTYDTNRTEIRRNIYYITPIAEEINRILAVLDHESLVAIDNSILANVSMKLTIEYLNSLSEDEAIERIEMEAMKMHKGIQRTLNKEVYASKS